MYITLWLCHFACSVIEKPTEFDGNFERRQLATSRPQYAHYTLPARQQGQHGRGARLVETTEYGSVSATVLKILLTAIPAVDCSATC